MGRAGLDDFGSDRCDICGVKFDQTDAKIWTKETGKVHFYPCYLDFKGKKEAKKAWEEELKSALLLIRNFRAAALTSNIDARAVRVALKYAIMTDDYWMLQTGKVTPEEEAKLNELADWIFQEIKRRGQLK